MSPHGSLNRDKGTLPHEASQQVEEIGRRFLDQLRAGETPDREALVSSHPELAGPLDEHLALVELMHQGRPEADLERRETAETRGAELPAIDGAEDIPRQIGPYRILEVLGKGGMGVVYLAEQRKPLQRRVALKLIKIGMDTREVIARFDTERQTLALMDHPHIAKVFDAGMTETGRPYFVMEPVGGVPVTDYCDKHRLAIRDRLVLFSKICDAVQHAHQKGIIHRDLKPTNILVTDGNGKARPKIIDFGVAKATNQRLTERTVFTDLGRVIGTPAYMSPEQAEGAGLDLDTRSDVFSLGVILYELLSGATPFSSEDLRAASLDEIRRRIREEDPPTPSTKASTTGKRAAAMARRRHMDPRTLVRRLRGDLDWITMKALEKDRTRRYATASELKADIARHLDHDPVLASPPTFGYRTAKFVRKHRVWVAAATAVVVALIAGLSVSLVMYSKAREDRRLADVAKEKAHAEGLAAEAARAQAREEQGIAEKEKDKAKVISEAMSRLLTVSPGSLGHEVKYVDVLDQAAESLDSKSFLDPEIEARLRHHLGKAYRDLGYTDKAFAQVESAFAMYRKALSEEHNDTLLCQIDLAILLSRRFDYEAAEETCRGALEELQRKFGEEDHRTLSALAHLGVILSDREKFAEAYEIHLKVLEVRRRLLGEGHEGTLTTEANIASALVNLGKQEEAETLYRSTLDTVRKRLGVRHSLALRCRHALGNLLRKLGETREAEPLLESALEDSRRVLGVEHPRTMGIQVALAILKREQGQFDEAESLLSPALKANKRIRGDTHPATLRAMLHLGRVYRSTGKLDESESLLRQTIEAHEEALGKDRPSTLKARHELAHVLAEASQLDEAERVMGEVLADQERTLGVQHPDSVLTIQHLSDILRRNKKLNDAEDLCRRVIESLRDSLGDDHRRTLDVKWALVNVLHDRRDFARAETLARHVLEKTRKALGEVHENTLVVWNSLIRLMDNFGDSRLADKEKLLRETLATCKEMLGEEDPATLNSLLGLGACLVDQSRYSEAEGPLTDALEACERIHGEEHRRTLNCMNNLAMSLDGQGRLSEAEPLSRRTVEIKRRVLGQEDGDTIISTSNLVLLLKDLGRLDAAEELGRQALETSLRAHGENALPTALVTGALARVLQIQGRLGDAEDFARQGVARCRIAFGDASRATVSSSAALGEILLEQGKLDKAAPLIGSALDARRKAWGDRHPHTLVSMNAMGQLLLRQGKPEESEMIHKRVVDTADKVLPDTHWKRPVYRVDHAASLVALERYSEAEENLTRSHKALTDLLGPRNPKTLVAVRGLVDLYTAWGKPEKAAEYQALLPPTEKPVDEEPGEESEAPPPK